MKIFRFIPFLAVCAFLSSPKLEAASLSLGFTRITSNSDENVANQLGLEILDSASALADYDLTIESNQVLFLFTNQVGISSSISEVYIDNGPDDVPIMSLVSLHNSLGGSTAFVAGPANPGDLPGGENLTPEFEAIASFSADAQGNPSLGVDASSDILGIVYSINIVPPSTTALEQIEASLLDGKLRIGLHVRSIGLQENSDGFVNNPPGFDDEGDPDPVPEPASIILFGLGTLGMGALARRRRQTEELELV